MVLSASLMTTLVNFCEEGVPESWHLNCKSPFFASERGVSQNKSVTLILRIKSQDFKNLDFKNQEKEGLHISLLITSDYSHAESSAAWNFTANFPRALFQLIDTRTLC